jgi:hypothetical protein
VELSGLHSAEAPIEDVDSFLKHKYETNHFKEDELGIESFGPEKVR